MAATLRPTTSPRIARRDAGPRVGDALATLVRSILVAGQKDCRALHLTIAQGRILNAVRLSGSTSPSELARAFGLSRQALTSAVEGLEREGLVERSRSPTDRRAVWIRFTARGRRLRLQFLRRQHAIHERVCGLLSAEEQGELARLLTRISDDLSGGLPPQACALCADHGTTGSVPA